jgi:hypothetical protein
MNRSLGCLTTTGMITAAITAALVTIVAFASGQRIFSPGALNAEQAAAPIGGIYAHAELERDCAACHAPFWSQELMGDRCLACHAATQAELTDETAFHFGFANPGNCRSCHTDHHGEAGPLTLAAMANFPHDRTGFSLRAHEPISEDGSFMCGECHTVPLGEFDLNACRACHLSYDAGYLVQHIQDFYPTCLGCHDGLDSYGAAFDHEQTTFPLNGEHAGLACGNCHAGAQDLAMLQATEGECEACHRSDNVHSDKIPSECGACHTPATWAEALFSHQLSGFDLIGSHLLAECESCHLERQWVGIPRLCVQCHSEADVHAGQFPEDCGSCHLPTGWTDITFEHDRSIFPLTGAHLAVECGDCHPGGLYVGTPTQCVACHREDDRHGGQFGEDCSACHTTNRWSEVTFDHQLSRFPLTGAHRNTPCLQCHQGGQYVGTPRACFKCHGEPSFHAGLFGLDCALCHSTNAWRPASFNGPHSFPMNHGGAGGTCSTCHPKGYTAYSCYNCHEHSQSEITKKHQEEGIGDFSNCVRCHPTGREEGEDD